MALPKLEGLIVITASTVVGTFGGTSVSVNAGSYYLTSSTAFLTHLASQIQTATGVTTTITLDDTSDTATGKVTMTFNSAMAVTWSSTTIRDLLGYTGNLASGTSHQSTGQAERLWLPNVGRTNVMAPEASSGAIETDYTHSMSNGGQQGVYSYTPRYVDTMEFALVQGSKAWTTHETVTNESFETFFRDVIANGMRIRFYKDRSDDATYREWYVEDGGGYRPEMVIPNWEGSKSLWRFGYRVRKYEA